jgi:dipeptidase
MRTWIIGVALSAGTARGCSNLLIPAGSSTDGSTIISYSADSGNLMADVSHWPAADHAPGDVREIYSWDFGTYLGAIAQPAHTYNVVGNTNEFQLTIGETTFGGLDDLNCEQGLGVCSEQGCIDYGQLIWVTLQRAKTAREAIATLDTLMQTYGYASSGESFSIADPTEVWMMEIIGKGKYAKGTVWVAVRIPDGHVAAHANQARIRTFARDEPDSVLYAEDVVDFARSVGLYNGSDADFSYSDTYDPVTFEGARFCEARVFTFFQSVADPAVHMEQYLDYVQGYNLSNRMPLYVKAGHKISVNETMWHMRNHFEGTWFDPRGDVGAQAWHGPNRLGEDLVWDYQDVSYVNERPIGTQYAAWNFVGVQRSSQKYSVLWFGADDSTFSLHTPFYGAASRVPPAWDGATCTGRDLCRARLGLPGTI